jgi:hypothetical protein
VPRPEDTECDVDDHFFVGSCKRVREAELESPQSQDRADRDDEHENDPGGSVGQKRRILREEAKASRIRRLVRRWKPWHARRESFSAQAL